MGFSNPWGLILLANVGTPLMWAEMFHLSLGNLVIGTVEGLLIARLFKVPRRRAVVWMIAANYFSAWVGFVLLDQLMGAELLSLITIYNAAWFLAGAGIVTYLLTLLLEWPFIATILRQHPQWRASSFKASWLVQTASYSVLALVYLSASGVSILTQTKKDRHFDRWAHSSAWVYYIAVEDSRVYRIKVDGTNRERVVSDEEVLFAHQTEPSGWALYVGKPRDVKISKGERPDSSSKIADGLDGRVLGEFDSEIEKQIRVWERSGHRSTKAFDLRNEAEFDWEARTGYWPIEGLSYRDQATGQRKRIALETPFLQWQLGHATILPGDQMVFQLRHQICILDPATMRLGIIAFGRCPMVSVPCAKIAPFKP
jgi:hypothetical protein